MSASLRRLAAAGALAVLLLSTQILFQPGLFELWSPADVLRAWAEYLAELVFIGSVLALVHVALDRLLARLRIVAWQRLPWQGLLLYAAAWLATVLVFGVKNGFDAMPPGSFLAAEALRWSVLAFYGVVMHAFWQHARRTDAQARAAAATGEALAREEQALHLRLLQAQIEPHFLFNTLATVRRLYRRQPLQGAEMMATLQRYLRVALPGVRRTDASLHDELELVRAYLGLLAVRMGPRLRFSIDEAPGAARFAFPPVVLLTLVENAVRHGLDPLEKGGQVWVQTRCEGGWLHASVRDDGIGLGQAETQGTGVGLVNIRRQLQARYGPAAQLTIEGLAPGVEASVVLPIT